MRTTPFHERTSALNSTGLWTHWAGRLSAVKYQLSEKYEYLSVRNSAGMFDTSPLYKYRIAGREATRFLAGVLARDIRECEVGRAQYTVWCDSDGWVVEDGVVLHVAEDEYLLSAARPNLAYFQSLVGFAEVEIEDVSDEIAVLALAGPRSTVILSALTGDVTDLGYFQLVQTDLGGLPVTLSRTGFTGDLGYEIWADSVDALALWDAVAKAGQDHGVIPFGEAALLMARIEAGLLLLDVDFSSSRYAWSDAERSTPQELGFGWMFRGMEGDDRLFIGRSAIERERANGSRWHMVGLMLDWGAWDDLYIGKGMLPPKDHTPVQEESLLYDSAEERAGYVSSLMYSPMLQRHIAIARVRPDLADVGTEVDLAVLVDHELQNVKGHVTRMPFYNPPHKTA